MSNATITPGRVTGAVGVSEAGAAAPGHTLIPASSRLTRLHYFDGKFLRADDLALEQRYLRQLAALGNQAGGSGVVHGFDCTLAGARVRLDAGLAIDGLGRVLELPRTIEVDMASLIAASRTPARVSKGPTPRDALAGFADCLPVTSAPADDVIEDSQLYVLTIGHAEAHCGEEDVYGKLCETACVHDTERPYTKEGIVLRAVPWRLPQVLPTTSALSLDRRHLRSRVASVYFEAERRASGRASLISRAGLDAEAWCRGALAAGGRDVPVALIARAGDTTLFLDAWTARRERMEAPPRHSWAWRMAMRPWHAYLAQVLQFQCQLRDALVAVPPTGDPDPCADVRASAGEASKTVAAMIGYLSKIAGALPVDEAGAAPRDPLPAFPGGLTALRTLEKQLRATTGDGTVRRDRILIDRGIVELPSAGYLPVVAEGEISVNAQVRALLGPGVDVRFCVVRHDFVPHALEEAQHMERISLLEGLDNPQARSEVDILVPDGKVVGQAQRPQGLGLEATLVFEGLDREIRGVGRGEGLAGGGAALHFAGATQAKGARSFVKATKRAMARDVDVVTTEAATEATTAEATTDEAAAAERPTELLDLRRAVRAADLRAAEDREATVDTERAGATRGTGPVSVRAAPIDAALLQRLATVADEANRHTARLRTERVLDTLGTTNVVNEAAGDDAPSTSDGFIVTKPVRDDLGVDDALLAMWATMSTAHNPFTMTAGDTTSATLDVALAEPGPPLETTEIRIQGTLRVDTVEGSDDRIQVTGRLDGTTFSRETGSNDGEPVTKPITLGVSLLWQRRADGRQVAVLRFGLERGQDARIDGVAIVNRKELFEVHVTWDGDPLVGQGHMGSTGDREPVIQGKARATPDVFDPQHALHTVARRALDIVGASLDDERFADVAGRKLFPPLAPADSERAVRATRGWVLFHRRRRKNCGEEAPAKPVPPSRIFQVVHAPAKHLDDAARIAKLLATGEGGDLFRPVAQVAFAPGLATLTSDPTALQSDWLRSAGSNALLVHRAVAAQPEAAAEGESLSLARLSRTDAELRAITPLHPELSDVAVLPRVPDALSIAGTDGVIILVTVAAPPRQRRAQVVLWQDQDGNAERGPGENFAMGEEIVFADDGSIVEGSLDHQRVLDVALVPREPQPEPAAAKARLLSVVGALEGRMASTATPAIEVIRDFEQGLLEEGIDDLIFLQTVG